MTISEIFSPYRSVLNNLVDKIDGDWCETTYFALRLQLEIPQSQNDYKATRSKE